METPWRVQVKRQYSECWIRSRVRQLASAHFAEAKEAVAAIAAYANENPIYRAISEDGVVAWEGNRSAALTERNDNYPTLKEMNMDLTADLPVINVDREQFLEALQPKLDEEVAKREAAEQARKDARSEYAEAVKEFTIDELVAILQNYWTGDAKSLVAAKESGQWVPKDVAPTQAETDLGRAVRVLSLSADKTIELRPGTNLYQLL